MKYEDACQSWYDDEIIDPLAHKNLSSPTMDPLKAIPGGQPNLEEFHKLIGYEYPPKVDPWG